MNDVIYAGDGGIFKTCTKCGEAKTLCSFNRKPECLLGLSPTCKACKKPARRTASAIITCGVCGYDLDRRSANHRYHDECAVLARKKPATVVGVASFACVECNAESIKEHACQKYCLECSDSLRTRGQRKGTRLATIECQMCGVVSELDSRSKWCADCAPLAKKEYYKEWRAANDNKIREDKRKYAEENADAIRERRKKYRAENPEKKRVWMARKRQEDPQFRLRYAMSNGIRFSLQGSKAGRSWETLVGYTISDLKRHLERQFVKGMYWKNYGPMWHVDHIVPDSSFRYTKPEDDDFKAAWALTNLRPLWANDNLKKNAKREFLI